VKRAQAARGSRSIEWIKCFSNAETDSCLYTVAKLADLAAAYFRRPGSVTRSSLG
jgi:hypothetical protein